MPVNLLVRANLPFVTFVSFSFVTNLRAWFKQEKTPVDLMQNKWSIGSQVFPENFQWQNTKNQMRGYASHLLPQTFLFYFYLPGKHLFDLFSSVYLVKLSSKLS